MLLTRPAAADYLPNKPIALVAGALYSVATSALFIRICMARNWWALCLPIGSLGQILRR
jgi:hypothetical protein